MDTNINIPEPIFFIDNYEGRPTTILFIKSQGTLEAAHQEFPGAVKKVAECLAQGRIDAYKPPYYKEKRLSINKSTSTDKYLQYWLDSTNAEFFALGGELALYQEAAYTAAEHMEYTLNKEEIYIVVKNYNSRNAAY